MCRENEDGCGGCSNCPAVNATNTLFETDMKSPGLDEGQGDRSATAAWPPGGIPTGKMAGAGCRRARTAADMNPSAKHPDQWLKFSTILPDFGSWLDRMARDSECAVSSLPLTTIRYGDDPRQWIETAATDVSKNVVPVMIHGGYWRSLKAKDHRFVLPALSRLGQAVANLEYRLMPQARMCDLVADAVSGLRAVAMAFPQARLLPIGHSAGAHLALSALHSDSVLCDRTAGVVCISGTFDLSLIASSFLQQELRLTVEEVARYSVDAAPTVPTLFITGTDETTPFHDQAAELANRSPHGRILSIAPCHHMNVLHGCLAASAPLVPVLDHWLMGRETPEKIEVSMQ